MKLSKNQQNIVYTSTGYFQGISIDESLYSRYEERYHNGDIDVGQEYLVANQEYKGIRSRYRLALCDFSQKTTRIPG